MNVTTNIVKENEESYQWEVKCDDHRNMIVRGFCKTMTACKDRIKEMSAKLTRLNKVNNCSRPLNPAYPHEK
jgi:hypothetical protein